jgi:tetratricopeptide (TPR) repeat protein
LPLALLASACLVLAGCATQRVAPNTEHAVELDGVPFFAQERYQCGPAALATVLVYSGVAVTPDELVPLVYVPERQGSFQAELKAATREFSRLPYELNTMLLSRTEPDKAFAALLDEVAAGNPVLVLQNLGFSWLPKWHYAVVIGYEPDSDRLLLRSGTEERKSERRTSFLRTWRLAGDWAMVALRPGDIPVSGSADTYLAMLADSERHINAADMGSALASGLREWPEDADLMFAAGNHARLQGNLLEAAEIYREALVIRPDHGGVLNNYADLLYEQSCIASALEQITTAQATVNPDSAL